MKIASIGTSTGGSLDDATLAVDHSVSLPSACMESRVRALSTPASVFRRCFVVRFPPHSCIHVSTSMLA